MSTEKIKSKISTVHAGVTQIGAIRQDLNNFVNYLTETPFSPPSLVDGIDQTTKDTITKANNNIASSFADAKKSASEIIDEVNKLQDFVTSASAFGRDNGELSAANMKLIKAFNENPSDRNKKELTEIFDRLISQTDKYLTTVKSIQKDFGYERLQLNGFISNIQADINTFQKIGKSNGDALNISKLSEADLKKQLEAKVTSLTSDISDLEKKFNGGIAGAVVGGAVGVAVAVTNFWNPIGWVAGLGTVLGEVFGGLELKKIKGEIDTDTQELALTEEEENLLQPLYTCQRVIRKMKEIVDHLTKVGTALGDLKGDFTTFKSDIQSYSKDDMAVLAGMDWENITSDFSDIEKAADFFTKPITDLKKIPFSKLKISTNPS